jgi:hypothetical protein
MKVLATVLLILLAAAQAAAQKLAPVRGDYAEVRSGEVFTCGCLYSSEMVTAGREAILVWRISNGNYRGTALAGIKVAAVVVSDTNLGAYSGARRSALYLDGITSEDQRQAILALWDREYSGVLGDLKAVHLTPFSFELQGETVHVAIPGIAEIQARKAQLPEDAHPGSFLWYGPFTALRESFLATALHYEYSGGDFQHQWTDLMPGIRGYVGKFALATAE